VSVEVAFAVVTAVEARGNLNLRRESARSSRYAAVRRKGSAEAWELENAISPFPGMEVLETVCTLVEVQTTLLPVPNPLSRHRRHR